MQTVFIHQKQFRVRRLHADDSIADITALLHRAYAGLALMGLKYWASHQSEDVTRERLEGALSLVAESDSGIVGTVTLYRTPEQNDCEWYQRTGVWHFGQFGVEPVLQRSGLGAAMMNIVEQYAKEEGAVELACDTAETAEHLIRWYSSRQYRFVQHVQWDLVNYRSVVLSKTL